MLRNALRALAIVAAALTLTACAARDDTGKLDYDQVYAEANGWLAVAEIGVAAYGLLSPCSEVQRAPCYDPAVAGEIDAAIADAKALIAEARDVAKTAQSGGGALAIATQAVKTLRTVLERLRARGVTV